MNRTHASFAALAALALLVSATGCAAVSGLQASSSEGNQDQTIIVMGHDPSKGGHHCVYTLDPDTFEPTFVANLGGDMHVDLLGASTTYDYDAKVVYVNTAYNDTTPIPATK
ncbi:MAG: hypothetical protein VXW79_01180, partial [Bacteroidota bacterium]|nr:hypothetical protein [Bacteroidota bacterium]